MASTCFTITAQYRPYLPSAEGREPGTTTDPEEPVHGGPPQLWPIVETVKVFGLIRSRSCRGRQAAVPVGFAVRVARGGDAGSRAAVARGTARRGGAANRAPLGDPSPGGDRAPRARKTARPPPRTRQRPAAGARAEVRLVALGRGS